MLNINNNSLGNSIYSNSTISNQISNQTNSSDMTSTTTTSVENDSLQLSNGNAINIAKGKDALSKTLNDFKDTTFTVSGVNGDIVYGDMTGPLAWVDSILYSEGKTSMVDLTSSSDSSMSFIEYTDTLTKFAKDNPDSVPSNFLDFCSELKSNLEAVNCK